MRKSVSGIKYIKRSKKEKEDEKIEKLFAAMVAMVMAFAMGVTVYAADITITNGAAGSEYAAYRLLNATDGGEGKFAYTLMISMQQH